MAVYAGLQTLLILREFQNFARLRMVFLEFQSELTEFRDIHGIPVRLAKHLLQDFQCRPWGYVGIYWNSPIEYSFVSFRCFIIHHWGNWNRNCTLSLF